MGPLPRIAVMVLAGGLCAASALAAPQKREPHVGYLFPAGAQAGTKVEVVVGGQFLANPTGVYLTGDGVQATVVKHYRPQRFIPEEQREALIQRLVNLWDQRAKELPPEAVPRIPAIERLRQAAKQAQSRKKPEETAEKPPELPDHPILRNLENKGLRELLGIAKALLSPDEFKKRQLNTQLSDMVLITVDIAPDATPGYRELRLKGALGISNPVVFQIGTLPEADEQEPNDPDENLRLPKQAPLVPPILVNGQITPGDVDRFPIQLTQGQRLVIQTHARRLIPYLADAVPGWFQTTVALYDDRGREVAFADDNRFDPDPVILLEVPRSGVYELEVKDALYRGREDFVYRLSIGETPYITSLFPLGGREGDRIVGEIAGWNLTGKRVALNTTPGREAIRRTALRDKGGLTNEVAYGVDTLPEIIERETNDDPKHPQNVTLPCILNGRIGKAGDTDVYRFHARAGDEVVAEALARRLGSPLDSLLRLTDATGKVLAWNDDTMRRDPGFVHPDMDLQTHDADSYLKVRLPADGAYLCHMADAQQHGGQEYAYRLRISPPRPDFELRLTPASLNIPSGCAVPVTVYALRKDGFDGPIAVSLKDAPDGFALAGAVIPAGRDSVRMTLTAPRQAINEPVVLDLEAKAAIGGKTIVRRVVPAEDAMQAFLYRHLVPSEEFIVAVTRGWGIGASASLPDVSPTPVPLGGAVTVLVRAPPQPAGRRIDMELKDPPAGLTLADPKADPQGLAFQLKAQGDALKPGFADNAIIEVFAEYTVPAKNKDAGAPPETRRTSLGFLPAVPYVVVKP